MEDLNELVKKEAKKLREFATKDELNKLDFIILDSTSTENCIYGQMTGSCYSSRASELLNLCAIPYVDYFGGEPQLTLDFSYYTMRAYSPIEYFIYKYQHNGYKNNMILIDYLQGKRDTLEFI